MPLNKRGGHDLLFLFLSQHKWALSLQKQRHIKDRNQSGLQPSLVRVVMVPFRYSWSLVHIQHWAMLLKGHVNGQTIMTVHLTHMPLNLVFL